MSDILNMVIFGIMIILFLYLLFVNIRDLIYLIRGKRYYDNTYAKLKEKKDGQYIDDFPFDWYSEIIILKLNSYDQYVFAVI